MNENFFWVEKYRPKTLDDYIFQNENHKASFEKMVADKNIPNILLSGVQGSGKTSLARILIDSLKLDPSDLKVINASDENNVETVREIIKNFVNTFGFSTFKVIHLEECDYMTQNGQAILRSLMEDFANSARFILTCNYEHKIIPAVRSRCQTFRFKKMNKNHVAEYVAKILISENVNFDLDTLDKFIDLAYPDVRKIVNMVQQYSHNGVLKQPEADGEGDYKFALLDLLQENNWPQIRELLCSNVSDDEWEGVYRFLYENLDKCPNFDKKKHYENWCEGIVKIAKYLESHAVVAIPELNATALFIELGMIGK